MRGLIFCFFILITIFSTAQNTPNQVDSQGRKQGVWSKRDFEGKLIYQGTFKDDKPVGLMKRFHSNGKVMAQINYAEDSDLSDAELFDTQGKLIAKGQYMDQKKTGEWVYYLNSAIVATETYIDGMKNGICKRYYKTGELLEESTWQNNNLHGIYRTYFQDGKVFLECNYANNQRNGSFRTWFTDGTIELDAFYTNDSRDKDWKYYDSSSNLKFTLKYESGKLLNPEVQDSIDRETQNQLNATGKNIPDPEKFMQNPEEYMLLMQRP